jgi:hypothetical protein
VLQCSPLQQCVHACCSSSQTCACWTSSATVPAATSGWACTLMSRWCVDHRASNPPGSARNSFAPPGQISQLVSAAVLVPTVLGLSVGSLEKDIFGYAVPVQFGQETQAARNSRFWIVWLLSVLLLSVGSKRVKEKRIRT